MKKKMCFPFLLSQLTLRELAEWFCSSLRNLVMCWLLQWRADLMVFLSVAVTPSLWAAWYLVQLEADVHWRSQILSWEETGTHLCTSDTKMLSLNHFQGLTDGLNATQVDLTVGGFACAAASAVGLWHSLICTSVQSKCLEWGSTFSDANRSTLNRTF